jgi:hypothetical protein
MLLLCIVFMLIVGFVVVPFAVTEPLEQIAPAPMYWTQAARTLVTVPENAIEIEEAVDPPPTPFVQSSVLAAVAALAALISVQVPPPVMLLTESLAGVPSKPIAQKPVSPATIPMVTEIGLVADWPVAPCPLVVSNAGVAVSSIPTIESVAAPPLGVVVDVTVAGVACGP